MYENISKTGSCGWNNLSDNSCDRQTVAGLWLDIEELTVNPSVNFGSVTRAQLSLKGHN